MAEVPPTATEPIATLSVATQVNTTEADWLEVLRSILVTFEVNELITGFWLSVFEILIVNVSVVVLPAASPMVAVIVLVELPKLKSPYEKVLVKLKVFPLWLTKVAPVTDLDVTALLSVATTANVTVCDWVSVVSVILLSLTVNELIDGSCESFFVTERVTVSVAVFPNVSVTVTV